MDIARAWDVAGNDLNGNGALDPGDVTKVLRAVVGIDPQPNRNRVPSAKMGGDDDEVETVLLFLKEKTASTVTVQIQLKDMQSTIAGANFQLEYPTELLRLKDKSSSCTELERWWSSNAAAIWNVSPAQTDYSQAGWHLGHGGKQSRALDREGRGTSRTDLRGSGRCRPEQGGAWP